MPKAIMRHDDPEDTILIDDLALQVDEGAEWDDVLEGAGYRRVSEWEESPTDPYSYSAEVVEVVEVA